MEVDQPSDGVLVLALEAVLSTDQLADVRGMVHRRLAALSEADRWRLTIAMSELVTNALRHGGRCTGVRVYELRSVVRIEVDDPSPDVPSPGRGEDERGLGVVAAVAEVTSWGSMPRPVHSDDEAGLAPRGKTVWCELHVERG